MKKSMISLIKKYEFFLKLNIFIYDENLTTNSTLGEDKKIANYLLSIKEGKIILGEISTIDHF